MSEKAPDPVRRTQPPTPDPIAPDVRSVAVVGCGYWGVNHVRTLARMGDIDVVPVDVRPGVAKSIADEFRLDTSAESLAAVSGAVDAVVLATPPSTHHDLGIEAIAAGCHVLTEKPLTTDLEQAERLIHAAESAGVVLSVGHTFLYSSAIEQLSDLMSSPAFGTPLHISCERLNLGLYRADVDVIWDLAPHDISILNHLIGTTPYEVQAWATKRRSDQNDIASLELRYRDPDVTATVAVSWLHPQKVRRMTIIGENQMIQYDDTSPEPLRIHDTAVRGGDDPTELSYERGGITIPATDNDEPLRRELVEFLDACRGGGSPRAAASTGRDVVAVLEAADRSLAEGQPVGVEGPPLRTPRRLTTSGAGT